MKTAKVVINGERLFHQTLIIPREATIEVDFIVVCGITTNRVYVYEVITAHGNTIFTGTDAYGLPQRLFKVLYFHKN